MPGNVGNIMRTAAALGVKLHIIGPFPFPMYSKQLNRAALDYGQMLDVVIYDNYESFKSINVSQDIFMITRYGHHVYSDVKYPSSRPLYLMFGSESSGIPHEILSEHKEKTIRIPMRPAARSLNLSNSVAIVAYEVYRQWSFETLALKEILKGPDYL